MIIDIQMNFESLRNKLQQRYSQSLWKELLGDIFGNQISFETKYEQIFIQKGQAKQVERFASIALSDYKNIAVLDILTSAEVQIARNRVALRDIVFNLIDQDKYHGLLVFYHSEDANQLDYRLSFISNQTVIDNDGNFVNKSTNPKRFSFILGENESCYTPAQRLLNLKAKQPQFIAFENNLGISIKDLTETFSVEALNKEFFKKYKDIHYRKLWEHIVSQEEYCKVLENNEESDADKKLKPVRDFAKKMLGRVVFLHYIQKKGWMGCTASISGWNDGDKHFIQNLFKHYPDKERFYSKCLTTLFYKVLNSRRKNDLIPEELMYKGKEGNSEASFKAPFLNGGLFDNDQTETNNFDFPVDYFTDLFDFFSQYNFTIDENSPDEQEVGIDPEMLGHIFENLLEENKDKGAFYTPKEIVHYMCQESLIQYLRTHLPECADDNSPATIAIENFIRKDDVGDRADKKNFIVQNASRINLLLDIIKICDPAIGSGAFPMGMLQEIFEAKCILNLTLNNAEKAQLKKDIIQNSIYGVDIESGAVDIARLRFWLSLVVEEEEPQPLPNLDYKIMQGNSLLEGIEDVDLSNLFVNEKIEKKYTKTKYEQLTLGEEFLEISDSLQFEETEKDVLNALLKLYFDFEESNFGKFKTKQDIKNRINKIIEDKLKLKFKKDREKLFAELEVKMSHLASNDIKPIDPNGIIAKKHKNAEKLNKEILSLENSIHELSNIIDRIKKWENKEKERPYFLWHTYFKDVFDEGGFDIVIGNPPYIQLQKEGGALAKMYEKQKFSTFERTGDIYSLFYEKGVSILNDKGVLCYITSNKWMRANYGASTRKFFAEKTNPLVLIDFGNIQVFNTATVDTNILTLKNKPKTNKHESNKLKAVRLDSSFSLLKNNIDDFVKSNGYIITSLNQNSWVVGERDIFNIKEFIEKQGEALCKWDIYIDYGIKTGLNEAFIIPGTIKEQIVNKDSKSIEIIKPVLRGKDVSAWFPEYENYWLVATFPSRKINIDNYIAVKEHLLSFGKERLEQDGNGRKKTGNKWFETQDQISYWENFEKPKIIFPNMTKFLPFVFDDTGIYTNQKCFIITGSRLKYLTCFFNSKLFKYCFSDNFPELQGGTKELSKVFFDKIPVKQIKTDEEEVPFSKIVDYLVTLKKLNSNNEMDQFIFIYFEQIANALIFEWYFGEEFKNANLSVAEHIIKMPDLDKSKEDVLIQLRKIFVELNKEDSPVKQAVFSMMSIPQVELVMNTVQ